MILEFEGASNNFSFGFSSTPAPAPSYAASPPAQSITVDSVYGMYIRFSFPLLLVTNYCFNRPTVGFTISV